MQSKCLANLRMVANPRAAARKEGDVVRFFCAPVVRMHQQAAQVLLAEALPVFGTDEDEA